jgi:hypothetical protein
MKCMGDFGALAPGQKTRRDRLREREPAMIRPVKPSNQNVIYYSEAINPQVKKVVKLPAQTVYSEKITSGISRPVLGKKQTTKVKKKVKLTKGIKNNQSIRIVKPVKPELKAPTKEFSFKAPTRELTVKAPTRELTVKAPVKELSVNPATRFLASNAAKTQAKKEIGKKVAPKIKVLKKAIKQVKSKPAKSSKPKFKIKVNKNAIKPKKSNGMSGNYCMGDFGEMGFKISMPKIKMPKIKMPEIRIGKRMQAEILKPLSKVAAVAAPAVALIPGVGTAAAAGIAAGGALAAQTAAKAEYDLAVKKAKDQQKKIEKQMAAEMTAQQQAEVQAQTNQQIAQAAQEKKKGMATAGILGLGAAAALGAFFLMKE